MKHTLALMLACIAGAAHAHHLWLEQDAQGATLYFGEFGDNLRETSPGLLDKFPGPRARKTGAQAEAVVPLVKTADGFVAKGMRVAPGESLLAEELAYPISERQQGNQTVRGAYMPAARLIGDFSAQQPRLTLDVVPTGKRQEQAVEFQVFFKGKPLPRAKVEVTTPSGWGKTHYTDANGGFAAEFPWSGRYVLELMQADTEPGERADGDKYDRVTYVTSLTVTQDGGLPPLPAPPAAKPNQ